LLCGMRRGILSTILKVTYYSRGFRKIEPQWTYLKT
jgi:hypothetical protein